MSSSLKRRIGEALLLVVILFMVMSICYKLLLPREDWLSYSIIWSICWALGHFVAKSIATIFDKGIGYFLLVDLVIIFVVLIVVTFIFGVVISLPTWKEFLGKTVAPFSIALVINSNWKRD